MKSLAPFSNDPQSIVYNPFINRETGRIKQVSHYFKLLSRTIIEYANHPEAKFDGETGVLERKHIQTNSIVYIGKEANNIDEQALDVKKTQEFVNKQEIMDNILNMSQSEAEALGVSRSRFQGIKQG